MPCDCILISGELLIDEQTLSGESIPVQKEPLKYTSNFSVNANKRHVIFDGTKILLSKKVARALVLRTGYRSYKGQIFRNALYPSPPKILFYVDVVKFLIVVAALVITLYFGLLWKMVLLDYDPSLIALRLGDAIVWIIPPNLITIINLAITTALARLKSKEIVGISPEKNLESS